MSSSREYPTILPVSYHQRKRSALNSVLAKPAFNRAFDAVFPGGLRRLWAGFATNASGNEDTAESPRPASFHEIGYLGVEAGPWRDSSGGWIPAPNTLRTRPNSWEEFKAHPKVVEILGRPACTQADCWKESNGGLLDQLAVGFVSLRHGHYEDVNQMLDSSIRASSPNTTWGTMMTSMAWSRGDAGAASLANRVKNAIAFLPEDKRWDGLVVAYATMFQRGLLRPGPASHGNPAYSIIRTSQKRAVGSSVYQANAADDIIGRAASGGPIDSSVALSVSPTDFSPGLTQSEIQRVQDAIGESSVSSMPETGLKRQVDYEPDEEGLSKARLLEVVSENKIPIAIGILALAGVGGYLVYRSRRPRST